MQTIKTAVVVVLLLVVLYGAYVAINGTEELPPEFQAMMEGGADLDVEVSAPTNPKSMGSTLTAGSGLKPTAPPVFGTPNFGTPTFGNSSLGSPAPLSGNSSLGSSEPKPLAPPQLATIPTINNSPFGSKDSGTDSKSSSGIPDVAMPNKLTSIPAAPSSNTNSGFTPPSGSSFPASSDNASNFSAPKSPTSPFAPPPSDLGKSNDSSSSSESVPAPFTGGGLTRSDSVNAKAASTSIDYNSPDSDEMIESPTADTPHKANITNRSFENARQAAIEQIDRGELKEALATLSVFYNSPDLSSDQNRDLIDLLDALAGETIYSRRHLLDTPYPVGPGEKIEDIAKKFEVPAELLAKINAVEGPLGPMPGTKLKVFRGPFRAEVDVKRNEMTVFLGDLYAGRFPVSTGADPSPKEGVYQVLDKQRNRNYYGKGGLQIDGTDPRNPYGGWWMDLGQDISIHGSPNNVSSETNGLGCISLSPLDASDVFSMLSRGSQVTIKR